MTRYQKVFFLLFVISLVVTFSPFKAFAYLLPYIGLLLLICFGQRWVILRNLSLLIMVFILLVLLHAAFGPEFVWQNAVLWVLTNGTLFFLLAVPSRGLYSDELLNAMFRLSLFFLVFESVWGIGQAFHGYLIFGNFDGAIGDFVSGTISPFTKERSFANPIFAANLSALIVFILCFTKKIMWHYWALCLGMVTLLLTSVLHLILSFFVAFGISQFLCRRFRPKSILLIASVSLFLIAGLLLTQRTNFGLYRTYGELIVENRIPKVEMLNRVATEIAPEDVFFSLFGYGPGQFLSRAGLIGTGRYLGDPENPRQLPLIRSQMTEPVQRHMVDLWNQSVFEAGYGGSAIAKPWSSWLAIGTELGILGFFAVLLGMLKIVWDAVSSSFFHENRQSASYLVFVVIFFGMIGLVEYYWETSQAVFVAILIAKLIYSMRWLPPRELSP